MKLIILPFEFLKTKKLLSWVELLWGKNIKKIGFRIIIFFIPLSIIGCDMHTSVIVNDTKQRIFIQFNETGKCNRANDYLDNVVDAITIYCDISTLDDITLTFENETECYVNMEDFRRKITTKPTGNAFGDVYYEIRLSQIKCLK